MKMWFWVWLEAGRTKGSLYADGWVYVPTCKQLLSEARFFFQNGICQSISWLFPQVSCLHSEPQTPPAFPGDPPRMEGKTVPDFMEFFFVLWPSTYETLCAPSKSGVSLSPSLVEPLHSNPIGFQHQMLQGLLLPMPDPQVGESDMESLELSLLWESLCNKVIFQFVDCSLSVYEIAYNWNHPSYHILVASSLFCGIGYHFSWLPGNFVDGCSADSCNFAVFMRQGEFKSFYFAILSGFPYSRGMFKTKCLLHEQFDNIILFLVRTSFSHYCNMCVFLLCANLGILIRESTTGTLQIGEFQLF